MSHVSALFRHVIWHPLRKRCLKPGTPHCASSRARAAHRRWLRRRIARIARESTQTAQRCSFTSQPSLSSVPHHSRGAMGSPGALAAHGACGPGCGCGRCRRRARSPDGAARIQQVEAVRGLDAPAHGQAARAAAPSECLRLLFVRVEGGERKSASLCSKLWWTAPTSFWCVHVAVAQACRCTSGCRRCPRPAEYVARRSRP